MQFIDDLYIVYNSDQVCGKIHTNKSFRRKTEDFCLKGSMNKLRIYIYILLSNYL